MLAEICEDGTILWWFLEVFE